MQNKTLSPPTRASTRSPALRQSPHVLAAFSPTIDRCLKALIADVPYSNKKLASMHMEERYRLILSTIFNAIGCRVEV